MQISSPMKRFFAYLLDAVLMGLILLSVVISWGVQIFFWTKGTSLGKHILKMRVVNKDTEEKVGFIHMLIREIIGKIISGFILYLGYIWILIDNDKFINSIVVDVT